VAVGSGLRPATLLAPSAQTSPNAMQRDLIGALEANGRPIRKAPAPRKPPVIAAGILVWTAR
jgi:hypothetical protein